MSASLFTCGGSFSSFGIVVTVCVCVCVGCFEETEARPGSRRMIVASSWRPMTCEGNPNQNAIPDPPPLVLLQPWLSLKSNVFDSRFLMQSDPMRKSLTALTNNRPPFIIKCSWCSLSPTRRERNDLRRCRVVLGHESGGGTEELQRWSASSILSLPSSLLLSPPSSLSHPFPGRPSSVCVGLLFFTRLCVRLRGTETIVNYLFNPY